MRSHFPRTGWSLLLALWFLAAPFLPPLMALAGQGEQCKMACSRAKQCCCKRGKDSGPAWKQQPCLNGCRLSPVLAPVAAVTLPAAVAPLERWVPAQALDSDTGRPAPPAEPVPYSQRQRPPPPLA